MCDRLEPAQPPALLTHAVHVPASQEAGRAQRGTGQQGQHYEPGGVGAELVGAVHPPRAAPAEEQPPLV